MYIIHIDLCITMLNLANSSYIDRFDALNCNRSLCSTEQLYVQRKYMMKSIFIHITKCIASCLQYSEANPFLREYRYTLVKGA